MNEWVGVGWLNGIQRGTLLRGAAAGEAGTKGGFQEGSTWKASGGSADLLSSDVSSIPCCGEGADGVDLRGVV